ncbi:hypothetical protein X777_12670 [Ooceraea biroi]|uniref:Uncharacterized protein n=1 Tax=Ooceraea biroi TaxID=2015173 RepID=A0A026VZ61_OOCBI|nr:hypothetical protein X777_12670 [Ooceraea biroi]
MPADWLSSISQGNCIYPSSDFLRAADVVNEEFENFHGDFFNRGNKIFEKITDIVCRKLNNNFPRKVISCLVRTRTYIRLRKFNKEIVKNNYLKKKCHKTYKICNKKISHRHVQHI